MTPTIELRPSAEGYFDFALSLYLSTMWPYAEELMGWDEAKQVASFVVQWEVDQVLIQDAALL